MSRTNSYSSADNDVRKILTQVSDNIMEDTDVDYWIEEADNYIDSKLSFKYDVPFTTTPPIIKTISSNLAAYFVLRTLKIETTEEEESWIKSLKDFALELLKEIAKGEINLVDSNGDNISTNSSYGFKSSTSDYKPTFNVDNEINWEVDIDRINDL